MTGAIIRLHFDGNEDTPGTTVKEMQTFDEWVNYDG